MRRRPGLRRARGVRPGHHLRQVARSLIADPETVGHSLEGRPLLACRFGGEAPAILLFGASHGDEPLGVACLGRLMAELVPPLPRETWILPIANPDGVARGTKNNARDVDLNRNFAAANWRREHAPGYDPGAHAESEPETQALAALIARIGATRLVALHSPFRVVNFDGPARALAEAMAAANGYGASGDIGYPTPGSFGSRYGADLGLEVITLEIPAMSEDDAWRENRGALRVALGLSAV